MNRILERYKEQFIKCKELNEKYGIENEKIEVEMGEIDRFRVTTPIIGGFSTGKSSMINAILGENILSMQITPETAIPTELYYGETDRAFIYSGTTQNEVTLEKFKEMEFYSDETDVIKIQYNNEFLKRINKVKLVDMPGFDSGIKLHNKAIDNYLPNSLAYIITFSADEPVIKESIMNLLRELKLHDIPVYVVITKCDKVTEEVLEEAKLFIRANISKVLEVNDLKIVCVKSKRDRNVEDIKEVLLEIQSKAEGIFEKSFSLKLKESANLIEKYIVASINNEGLSIPKLEEEERKLEKNIEDILIKLEKEKEEFEKQLQKCISVIKSKVASDLSNSATMLENMILKGTGIQEKINIIIRSAITLGIKNEFEPKLRKYLKNISSLIEVDMMLDTEIDLDTFKVATDNMIKEVVIKAIPVVLATIGGILAGPVGAIIGGAVAILVDTFFKSKHEKEKRELAREKVQREIIPHVVEATGVAIEKELIDYVDEINKGIESDLKKKKDIMKKSLQDIRVKKQNEQHDKEERIKMLNSDLEVVRGLKNEI
ncbi:MAG: dynamin family protein [Clostridium sp.]